MVEVTLPDWLYQAITKTKVLQISPDYFRIRKAIDRRLYEIARKHCGSQAEFTICLAEDTEDFSLTQSIKAELPIKQDPKIVKKEIKIVPETKSKQVQMLMQPSLYNEIKKKAEQKGVSVNEMMHEILKSYVTI